MTKTIRHVGLMILCLLVFAPLAIGETQLQQVMLAEDISAKASLDDVLAGQLTFKPIAQNALTNLGSSDSAFWLRIQLANTEHQIATRWLVIGQPRIRYISLFQQQEGHWQETRGGMAEPFSTRIFPTLCQIFVLELPPNSIQTVLVRVASETVMLIEPSLWKPEQFLRFEWQAERVVYITSGILLLALLFGLLLTLFAREPGFLVYGLAALFYLLFILSISGLAYRELWPNSPDWALHSIGFFQAISMMMLLFVHRLLLKTALHQPYLDRVVQFLIICFLLLAFLIMLSFAYYRMLVFITMSLGLIVAIGSPVLGFVAWRHNIPLYGYGFAAYALPWQLSLVQYFSNFNWLPPVSQWFSFYAVPIALLFSTVLILGGLANHINRVRYTHSLLEQEQRDRLEALVMERTQELERAKTMAEQTLEDQHQFLSMVSHEVRTPLASIKTATQLLELHTKDDDAIAILHRILRGTHRLTQFFNNYLTFDRLNSLQWVLCETQVKLPMLLHTACENFTQIDTHNITLSVDASVKGQHWLYADAQLLLVLLNNLLENAIKYSPIGSTINLQAYVEQDKLKLSVSDQGIGISNDELDLVFNKFFRSTQVGRVVGAGLGLYLVRQIIDLHGGSIKLKSLPGQGTTITLTFPQQRWINE